MTRTLTITRIDCARDDARVAMAALRRQLSPKGDVVSPRGREKTLAVFGAPLTPQQVATYIVEGRHRIIGLNDLTHADRLALSQAIEQAHRVRLQAVGQELDWAIRDVMGTHRGGVGTRNAHRLEQILAQHAGGETGSRAVIQAAINEIRWVEGMRRELGNLRPNLANLQPAP